MLKTPRSLAPRGFQSDLHFRTKRRFGGRDGNRTRTPYNWRRILSPLRLPIPSPGQCQTFEKRSVKNRPFYEFWSGKRGSNSRHQPWQGCTLPTELFPHLRRLSRVIGGAKRSRTALNGFAIRCITALLSRHRFLIKRSWSGKRGSNSRHQPWQGCTLPTELFPHRRI